MKLDRLPEPTNVQEPSVKTYLYSLIRAIRTNEQRQLDSVDLSATGVTAGTYGTPTQVGTFTVGADGRLTSAVNTAILITASQVSDFNEAAQDAVGTILIDSSNIDFTYNDGAPSITADLTTTGVTPGTYGDADSVGTFTVDAYGRLTFAGNVDISITTANIEPDWTMQFMLMGA